MKAYHIIHHLCEDVTLTRLAHQKSCVPKCENETNESANFIHTKLFSSYQDTLCGTSNHWYRLDYRLTDSADWLVFENPGNSWTIFVFSSHPI